MRILLLGGSGLISGPAAEAFLHAGHEVWALNRRSRGRMPVAGLQLLAGDRRDAASLTQALGGRHFDFTADFLAFDGDDVRRLLAVPGFDPGRLAVISSGQVYLVTADPRPPFREADADAPLMVEPEPGTPDHGEWRYGMGKRAAEAALLVARRERGLRTLALRLPVIQGEGDRLASRRLWAWIERMRDGGPVLLPEGGRQRVRFLYAGDAARALVELAARADWPEEAALNLAQPDEPTLREFLERVAAHAGLSPRFVPVDAATLAAAGLTGACAPYWGRWCSRPDPSRALEVLAVRPRSVAEYLPGVVAAHLEPPVPEPHPGYVNRPLELALAHRIGG